MGGDESSGAAAGDDSGAAGDRGGAAGATAIGGAGAAAVGVSPVCDNETPGKPRILATTPLSNDLAFDQANLYFPIPAPYCNPSCQGSVNRVSKCGGAVQMLATMQPLPLALGTNGKDVYFADAGSPKSTIKSGIYKVPVMGGQVSLVAGDEDAPNRLTVHGASVYWGGNGGGEVLSTSGTPVHTTGFIGALVADDTNVYFSTSSGIYKLPVNGITPAALVTGLSNANPISLQPSSVGIATDGTNVYWADLGTNAIRKVAIAGGEPADVASNQPSPTGVASDGTNVYFTRADGTVAKTSVAGDGSVITLATGQSSPGRIAVDDASVYWVNGGDDNNFGQGGALIKLTPK